jgi:MFS family permease
MSTYSFWALFFLYCASMLASSLSTALSIYLSLQYGWNPHAFSIVSALKASGILTALALAWIAVRWKPKAMLVLVMLLQAAGFAMVFLPAFWPSDVSRTIGAVLWGVGSYATLLTVIALIAGSAGGAETFVVAFGVLFTIATAAQMFLPAWVAEWLNPAALFSYWPASAMVVLLLLAVVAALFLRRNLFRDPPPPRGYSFPPVGRSPVAAALLSAFVPFYILYWLYRIHGETASVAPSRALLSPRAAVGIAFVPLMSPYMLTTVIDELNRDAARRGLPRLQSAGLIFFLSLFIAPVAIGLVQSALNQAASSFTNSAQPVSVA